MSDTRVTEVPAIHAWPSNGHLIADVNRLYPLGTVVLDTTYGRGRWWTEFRPPVLITNDIDPAKGAAFHEDFRRLPFHTPFDTVAFDPPYKLNGTPSLGDFDHRYGVEAPRTWQERMKMIRDGAIECYRLVRPGGLLLAKVQDQVCSGKMRWQTHLLQEALEGARRMRLVDRFEMIGGTMPQPSGRRQVHARGRGSTLMVFRKEGK